MNPAMREKLDCVKDHLEDSRAKVDAAEAEMRGVMLNLRERRRAGAHQRSVGELHELLHGVRIEQQRTQRSLAASQQLGRTARSTALSHILQHGFTGPIASRLLPRAGKPIALATAPCAASVSASTASDAAADAAARSPAGKAAHAALAHSSVRVPNASSSSFFCPRPTSSSPSPRGAVPSALELEAAHATIPDTAWTLDAHGDPDWRRAVALVLAQQIRRELA